MRVILILTALILSAGVILPARAATSEEASQLISDARAASSLTYSSLRSAQLAGADVRDLAVQFNQALYYLQSAENYYDSQDYESAARDAGRALQIFASVREQAEALWNYASTQRETNRILVILAGVITVALVTLGFHLTEKWCDRRWLKRLPQMRIRLVERKDEDT